MSPDPGDSSRKHGAEEQLEAAGYEPALKREFNFIQGASIGFADISPIVSLYGVFGLALAAAGPPMFWGLILVYAAMMLVALVLAEVSSLWPLAGGIYQWTRQQVGARVAWFAGWTYAWASMIGLSALAFGAATYFVAMLGITASTTGLIAISLGFLAFTTIGDLVPQKFLKAFVIASVTAELLATVGVGIVLLVGFRMNSLSVLFDSFGTQHGSIGSYLTGAWLAAIAILAYATLGFEATGAIGEEVRDPERQVPKAIVLVLALVGTVVIVASLALILANPDIKGSLTGNVADPVVQTLSFHFGSAVTKVVLGMITLAFLNSQLALQTAVSRVVFSFARDGMTPGARHLSALTTKNRLPANAVIGVATVAALVLLVNLGTTRVFQTLISFVAAGFYIAFAFPVLAALYLHLKGRHQKGPFNIGRWSFPVTLLAGCWLVLELINIARPVGNLPWYQDWGVLIMIGVLGALGVAVYVLLTHRSPNAMTDPVTVDAQ